MQKIRVPVILGPTAVGKTDISLQVASELGCEIISCDSRQIYRYMDIGTAKPSREEMEDIHHRMIDIVDPSDCYSAYQYSQEALTHIRNEKHKSKPKLICGGTGLYFKSLQDGIGPQVASDITFRKLYQKRALKEGNESLYKELQKYDPESAARLHPNDLQRVIRALQVYYVTGSPLSVYQKKKYPPNDVEFMIIILLLPREILYTRINNRVDAMMKQGLWDEFWSLRKKGYKKSSPGMHCVGYKELFEVENGLWGLSEAVEKIKKNSRNYAKRQITWFTHKTTGVNIDMSGPGAYTQVKERIINFLDSEFKY